MYRKIYILLAAAIMLSVVVALSFAKSNKWQSHKKHNKDDIIESSNMAANSWADNSIATTSLNANADVDSQSYNDSSMEESSIIDDITITHYTMPYDNSNITETSGFVIDGTPSNDECTDVSNWEYTLLVNLVAREYGSDYVPTKEKAKVVATVMNRVNDSAFPNTIYDVITQPNQFEGYLPTDTYTYQVTDDCIAAVNYYFEHTDEFGDYKFFYGDSVWNYFY